MNVIARPKSGGIEVSPSHYAEVSFDPHDPDWDAFVGGHGGHYKQSSAWANLKGAFDWKGARIRVMGEGRLVAGAQVLLRQLPVVGTFAYAPEAPVLAVREVGVVELVLDKLRGLAEEQGARILIIHPPRDNAILESLIKRGYRRTSLAPATAATSVVDLRPDEDVILARMRKKTRQHIRKGMREGVTIRQGDDRDIATVYRLHVATAERKGLPPVYPERYFAKLWDSFRPLGSARLFLATCEEEVVSCLFVLAFGDTVYTMVVAWSGRHGARMPNELLHWHAMQWAKDNGYNFWDFSAVNPPSAAAIVSGRSLPDEVRTSTTFFKLGFGGEVVFLPETYELVLNPWFGSAYRAVAPLYRSEALRRQIYRLRWGGLPALLPRLRRS
jgi:peptidoglycan pentaglycine glycine transferase (the first glycine)